MGIFVGISALIIFRLFGGALSSIFTTDDQVRILVTWGEFVSSCLRKHTTDGEKPVSPATANDIVIRHEELMFG